MLAAAAAAVAIGAAPIAAADPAAVQPATIAAGPTAETVAHGGWGLSCWHSDWQPWFHPFGLPW
jgi:hypothetical protein